MPSERFEVRLITAARHDLAKLPEQIRVRIIPKLESLETNPLGADTIKLEGRGSSYRMRVGDYRILYRVDTSQSVVWVDRIAHRRDVYR